MLKIRLLASILTLGLLGIFPGCSTTDEDPDPISATSKAYEEADDERVFFSNKTNPRLRSVAL